MNSAIADSLALGIKELSSVTSALIGASASFLGFMWLDGRRKVLNQTAGLRVMVLMAEAMCAAARQGKTDITELKLDWLTPYMDVIVTDWASDTVVRDLISLRFTVLNFKSEGEMLQATLDSDLNNLRERCISLLSLHLQKKRQIFFLLK